MLIEFEPNYVKCGMHIPEGVNLCNNADATMDYWIKIIEKTNWVELWATEKSNRLMGTSGSTDYQFLKYNRYN